MRLRSVALKLREVLSSLEHYFKLRSVELVEAELRELELVFTTLVLGPVLGLHVLPTVLTLRLLPHMLPEVVHVQERTTRLDDVLGEIASLLEVT